MTWELFLSEQHLKKLGIAITIFLLFLLLRKIFAKYIYTFLLRISKKAPNDFFSYLFESFKKPLQWLFITIGLYIAVRYYPYLNHQSDSFVKLLRASIIALIGWGFFNLSSGSHHLFRKINETTTIQIDDILIPFLSRILQFIVVALTISVILQELDYKIDGFIAGLGLGGLAISLAAKEALANLFGGIVLITEKPFTIGDWVMTPSVEGTVEDISFRSTKVRTFSQAIVTVPNATLANEPITNWSKMGKRQIKFTIRVTYDNPASKIKHIVQRIEQLLKSNPDIHPETILVSADTYQEDGIDIFLYFFTKTTDWEAYLNIRQQINLDILEIIDDEEVTIAIPSRRLLMDDKEFESLKDKR